MVSIKHHVNFGIKWFSVSLFLNKAARFLTSIVLARLLVPEMFGIVAMANVTIETIGVIREIGFGAAYIQRKDNNEEEARLAANTTFFLGLAVNISLFLLCSLLSPIIADFFNVRQLEKVLRIMFFAFILDAVMTVPSLTLQKRLEFGKYAICEITQGLSYGLIGISLALMGFGVWSLVFAQLASKCISAGMAFKLSRWSPRFEFSGEIANKLFAYGKFIWAFVLVSAVGGAIDKTIIGKFLGAASLGFYGLAFNLCNMPATLISFLISRITFPVFSKLQHDKVMLKRAFLKTLSHVSIISMPLAFGLMIVSEELILTIYGSKWEPVAPLIKVLAFYGLVRSVSAITGSVFKAIGKPNVLFYTSIVHHIILISLLLLLKDYGVIGICYAVLIPLFISSIIAFTLLIIFLGFSIQEITEPILRSGFSSVAMFLAVKFFSQAIEAVSSLPVGALLVGLITIGIAAYFFITLLTNRSILIDVKNTFIDVVSSNGKLI